MVYNSTRNIGLVGLTQSGKTTFLTSLLDHWSNHRPERFPLGKNPQKNKLGLIWRDASAERRFETYRHSLASGQWLEKTLECTRFPFSITCPAWWRDVNCVVYDVPGERLADAEMLRYPKLRDWSDAVVHRLTIGDLSKLSAGFRAVYDRQSPASEQWASELEAAYRDLIGSCVRSSNPFITPSSVLVDGAGGYVPREYLVGEQDISQWLNDKSVLGLGKPAIIPLPSAFNDTDLLAERQRHYWAYRQKVVKPALNTLSICQDIVVLVDVAAILAMGPEWKNQTTNFLKSLIQSVAPKSWWIKNIWDAVWWATAGFGGGHAERIIFVATQSDRVHSCDRDHLGELLQDLAHPATANLTATGRINIDFRVVSAIVSTESGDDRILRYRDIDTNKDSSCKASPVPVEFADSWDPNDYNFPLTAPRVPVNQANPPRQDGLEGLTELLLNIQ